MRTWKLWIAALLICLTTPVWSQTLSIKMYATSNAGKGRFLGTIIATNTKRGVLFIPRLHGLSPGFHGFHLHAQPSCENAGMAAGGHWDPYRTERHRGPYRLDGHRGDLPRLYVSANGQSKIAVLAPHIKLKQLKGHALIIHQGGDNYSDTPKKLGGGGVRIACGIVP